MKTIDNLSMTLACGEHQFRVVSIREFENGGIEVSLESLDVGGFTCKGYAPGMATLAQARFGLLSGSGKLSQMRRIMRRPWRYEQMTDAKLDDALAPVTPLRKV